MRRLKLGIIGTGIATNDLAWPELKALGDKIQITAVANRRKAKALAFARKARVPVVCDSGEALLKRADVEAVMLSLPIHLNAAWVLKALRAGKHVICEKPLAASVEEGERLVQAASQYKKLWLVGENYYFAPHIVKAREWLASGRIGRPRLLELAQISWLRTDNKYYKTRWRQDPKHMGGFVVDAGVHLADIAREMLGMPVETRAFSARFNPRLRPIDSLVALMRFRSGAIGVWRSCFSGLAAREMAKVTLRGSKGTLEIFEDFSVLTPLSGSSVKYISQKNGFYHEYLHFYKAVVQHQALGFKPAQALADLRFMQTILHPTAKK